MVKKSVKKKSRARTTKSGVGSNVKKINVVGRRLIFFLIFFVVFVVLNAAVSNGLWSDFFGMGTWIFGFISASLFIVLLVLWFLKLMKK